jgi:transcriptional regulator with XRE-family HTH domain
MREQPDLIDLLRQRQQSLGETDLAFSRRIGMSRQMWQVIRTGRNVPGARSLGGITAAFRDDEGIAAAVRSFLLSSNANTLSFIANKDAEEVPA